jgi:hypothetical protein
MKAAILERRPMTTEERPAWIKRVRQAQAQDNRCRTCGERAFTCFGDALGDGWYVPGVNALP